jgi:NADH dehydrogenase
MTLKEIIAYTLKVTGRHRLLVNLPWRAASLLGSVAGLLPKPAITADQVELLKKDNLVSDQAKREGRTFEALGIKPQGVEAIVPAYLYRFRKAGQFSAPEQSGS